MLYGNIVQCVEFLSTHEVSLTNVKSNDRSAGLKTSAIKSITMLSKVLLSLLTDNAQELCPAYQAMRFTAQVEVNVKSKKFITKFEIKNKKVKMVLRHISLQIQSL